MGVSLGSAHGSITIDTEVGQRAHHDQDWFRRLEIHIRHPQGQHIRRVNTPLLAITGTTVMDTIEIWHESSQG